MIRNIRKFKEISSIRRREELQALDYQQGVRRFYDILQVGSHLAKKIENRPHPISYAQLIKRLRMSVDDRGQSQ